MALVTLLLLSAPARFPVSDQTDAAVHACDMATGLNTVWCGYQCYTGPDQTQMLNNCRCNNCCGPDCWTWEQSMTYMNNISCVSSTEYRLTSAKQAGDTQNCNVGGPCSWTSVFGDCANLTVCAEYEYESIPPTRTTDRGCRMLTNCTSGEYQSVASTPTTDRGCTSLTVCSATEYASVPPTPTSDRECSNLTVCSATEYASVPPTPTTDRECSNLTVCGNGPEAIPPTPTSDRQCKVDRDCPFPQWVVEPATETSKVVCSSVAASVVTSVVGGSALLCALVIVAVWVVRNYEKYYSNEGKQRQTMACHSNPVANSSTPLLQQSPLPTAGSSDSCERREDGNDEPYENDD
jgi:hypothetical protein